MDPEEHSGDVAIAVQGLNPQGGLGPQEIRNLWRRNNSNKFAKKQTRNDNNNNNSYNVGNDQDAYPYPYASAQQVYSQRQSQPVVTEIPVVEETEGVVSTVPDVSLLDAGVRVFPSPTVITPDISESLRRPNTLERQVSTVTEPRTPDANSPSSQLTLQQSLERVNTGKGGDVEDGGGNDDQPLVRPQTNLLPPRRMKGLFDDDDEDLNERKQYEEQYRKYLEYQVALKNAKSQADKDQVAKIGSIFDYEDEETTRRRRLEQQQLYRRDLGANSQRSPSMPSIDEMGEWDLVDGATTPRDKDDYRRALEEQVRNRKNDNVGLQFMAGFDLKDGQESLMLSEAVGADYNLILTRQQDISNQVRDLSRIAENLGSLDNTLNDPTSLHSQLAELESDLATLERTQQQVVQALDTSKSSRKMRRVAQGNDSAEAKLGLEVQRAIAELEETQRNMVRELQAEVDMHKQVFEQEGHEFEKWLEKQESRRQMPTDQKMALLEERFAQIQGMEQIDINRINQTFNSQFAQAVEQAMYVEAQKLVDEVVGQPILGDLLCELQQLQDESDQNEQQLTQIQEDVYQCLDSLTRNIVHMEGELAGTMPVRSVPQEEDEVPSWLIRVIEERFVDIDFDEDHVDVEVSRILTSEVSHNTSPEPSIGSVARKLQRNLWNQERNANGFDMWDIVKNMAKSEVPGYQRVIDPSQCYAVGAVLTTAPEGLPVTFTVYTVLEDSAPCTSGGANIVAYYVPTNQRAMGTITSSTVQENAILHLRESTRQYQAVPGEDPQSSRHLSYRSEDIDSDEDQNGTPNEIIQFEPGVYEVIENDLPMEAMEHPNMPRGEGNKFIKRQTRRNLLAFKWLKRNKNQHTGQSEEDRNMVTEAAEVLQRLREMQATYWGPNQGISLGVRDLENGAYYLTGKFDIEGQFDIYILVNNQHIHGSPFTVNVVGALCVGSGIGPDKLICTREGVSYSQLPEVTKPVLFNAVPTSTNPGWQNLIQSDSQRAETVGGLDRSQSSSSISQQGDRQLQRPSSAPPRTQVMRAVTPVLPSLLHPVNAPIVDQLAESFRTQYARKHPCVGDIDVVFLVDGTSSMMHELNVLADQLPMICHNIEGLPLCKSLKIALLVYKDHNFPGRSPGVVTKVDFTDQFDHISQFLDQFEARGGGDYPEAMEYALDMCGKLPWREHSSRLAIILGDAPPHGYEGLYDHEANERQKQLDRAKEQVMHAARKLEKYIKVRGFKQGRTVGKLEYKLEQALNRADAVAQYHDEYSRGAPGGHLWQEAAQKLSDLGVTVIAFGFREAIQHEPSQACLRAITHITHGALVDLPNITSDAMNDFIASACNVLLSRSLVLEEMVDLALSTRSRLTTIGAETRMAEVCHALNAVGSQIAMIEGQFIETHDFVLLQKNCSLTVEFLSPIVRALTQKSNVVMNGLARQYPNDPMRWVVDAWTQLQREGGLNDERVKAQFNSLELTLIRNRQLLGLNITPFDLRYVLAHAILSSGY